MTTKYKIISGFTFMMFLLIGLALFSWMRLDEASKGFDSYRAEANTSVNSNASDALMREAKDKLSNFVLTLDPSFAEQSRKDLEASLVYAEETLKAERNPENRRKLSDQIAKIRKMNEFSRLVQDKLLISQKLVTERMYPAADAINNLLTDINGVAAKVNNVQALAAIDDAYSLFADMRLAMALYNATYVPADGVKSYKMLDDFNKVLDRLSKAIIREETRKSFDALTKGVATFAGVFKESDAAIKDSIKARAQFTETATEASKFFDVYATESLETMKKLGAANKANNEGAQRAMSIGSAIGVIVGLAFAILIVVGVVRVLGRVSAFAAEIAKGNFGATLNVREGGEIGTMVKSMQAIPATLNAMASEYHRLEKSVEDGYLDAQGDVSKFSGEFASIMRGANNILKRMSLIFNNIPSPMVMLNKDLKASFLNKVAQDLAGSDYHGKTCGEMFCREDYGSTSCGLMCAVRSNQINSGETVAHPRGKRLDIKYTAIPMLDDKGKLASVLQFIVDLTQIKDTERRIVKVANEAQEIADRVAAAAEELSAQIEQVSRGAEMQRTRMESTATAMSQMNSTVLEVARNAGHASEQSDDTRRKAEDGATLVGSVVSSINGVNTVALGLQTNMQGLGAQAESIGGVMNVISDIADQTNLLALNAAIEAARAGEAGRGFAVVADEVRKLAEKTMDATKEVGANIQAIQNSAHANINDVTTAVRNIGEATDLANSSGQALQEILSLASASSTVVASIATAAEEQSATSEEINISIEDVSRIVAETSQGMTQASAAVQDLSMTAQQLKRVMDGLRS